MHGTPSLIGRTGALAEVAAAIRAARPVAVVGEAGIGKTTLVRAAARCAGRRVREGGGFATLSWLPYLALRRAADIGEADDPGSVAEIVEGQVGGGLLFIDDLQWADEPTRAVVDLVLGRIAVAVAIREGETGAGRAIRRFAARGGTVVRLRGLDARDALRLAAVVMPASTAPVRRQVVEAAGGNPMLIEELAAHGEASSWLTRAIVRQVEALSPAERGVLEALAAGDRPVSAASLPRAGHGLIERGLLVHSPLGVVIRHRVIIDALAAAEWRPPRAVGTSPDDPGSSIEERVGVVSATLAAGRLREAAADAASLLAAAATGGFRRRLLTDRGLALGLLGRVEEADACLAEALALAESTGVPPSAPGAAAGVVAAWAEVSFWGGRPRRALDQAAHAIATSDDAAERARAVLAGAWAEVDLGRLPGHARADARGAGTTGPGSGAWTELRGLDHLASGRLTVAAAAFEDAARAWAGTSVPRQLVCRWAAAEARRRSGDPDAMAGLETVLAAASEMGFEPLAARTRRSLRLAGARPAPLRARRVAGDPLTARERQVLELVERGRTNLEIARRMGLGRPTVARMLSNAMVKLGAQSRAHLVVLASKIA